MFHRGIKRHLIMGATVARKSRDASVTGGGHLEAAYERAARLADGFIFADGNSAAEAGDRVRHHLGALGKDESRFGRELFTQFAGSPSEAADQLKRWRDAGGTHGSVPSTNNGRHRRAGWCCPQQ